MNITASKNSKIINYIAHLCNDQDKLYIMPDSVHIFKNIASSMTSGKIFYLDKTTVEKYDLPSKKFLLYLFLFAKHIN